MTDVALGSKRAISPSTRAGLDLARGASALYVVAHHVMVPVEAAPWIEGLFAFSQEAVMVFFLLSGFVIFANEQDRCRTLQAYYLRRLRRIYPPLLVAMLLSSVLWAAHLIDAEFSAKDFVGTLLSVQDWGPRTLAQPYLGNAPLWSLSYEMAYYAVFPLVMTFWRRDPRQTNAALVVLSLVAFVAYVLSANHFALVAASFCIWWAGAMVADAYLSDRLVLRQLMLPFLTVAVMLAVSLGLAAMWHTHFGSIAFDDFPAVMVRQFGAAALALAIVVSPARTLLGNVSLTFAAPAAWLASISYGIYVFHFPLMIQTGWYADWRILPASVAVVVLAFLVERKMMALLPRAPRG